MSNATYPAEGVNSWLLEQRDKLRERRAELLKQDLNDRLVYGEYCRVEGALAAVETSFEYFGKMWIG